MLPPVLVPSPLLLSVSRRKTIPHRCTAAKLYPSETNSSSEQPAINTLLGLGVRPFVARRQACTERNTYETGNLEPRKANKHSTTRLGAGSDGRQARLSSSPQRCSGFISSGSSHHPPPGSALSPGRPSPLPLPPWMRCRR